jgi:hypothetical protein
MLPSDLDITRTAHLWIQQHGDEATASARRKVEEMRRRGDTDGADTLWRRPPPTCSLLAREGPCPHPVNHRNGWLRAKFWFLVDEIDDRLDDFGRVYSVGQAP